MAEYLLSILLCVAMYSIINWIRGKRHQRAAYRAPDSQRIKRLEADAAARLKARSKEWLMLEDYHFQTKISPAGTVSLQETTRQLQAALIELLSHVHILPNVKLEVTDDPAKLVNDAAGEYVHGPFQKIIRVLVKPGDSGEYLLSVLCHETSHYILYTLGINDPDSNRNEGLTDVTACLIGFSETMIRAKLNRNPPYLNVPEFEQVRKLLLTRRAALQKEKEQAAALEASRQQLRKNLDGARAMQEQVRAMIAVNKAPQKGRISASELRQLQRAMLQLENGSYTDTMRQAEAALKADAATVRRADAQLMSICADMVRLMLAFSP